LGYLHRLEGVIKNMVSLAAEENASYGQSSRRQTSLSAFFGTTKVRKRQKNVDIER